MKVSKEYLQQRRLLLKELDNIFAPQREVLQDLASYILPIHYPWTAPSHKSKKDSIDLRLDSTATDAARTLANGLVNGITAQSRPWFRTRPSNIANPTKDLKEWLEESDKRIYAILAGSNFYHTQATHYLQLVTFGTAATLMYEDFDSVVRFYPVPVGQFRVSSDFTQRLTVFSRKLSMTVTKIVEMFGLDNVSPQIKAAWKSTTGGKVETRTVWHIIEKNVDDDLNVPLSFEWREVYFEDVQNTKTEVLRVSGFHEKPFVAPRWEVTGTEDYGTSPAHDALPDIKQLQQEVLRKGQAVDGMIRPALAVSDVLAGDPKAFLPGGITYIPPGVDFHAAPVHVPQIPLQELAIDIQNLQNKIRQTFYNHLFRNVSNLDTVRSAAEIYERKNEDLLLLGGILERYQQEALDPIIKRVYGIAFRKGLLPELPDGVDFTDLEIEYVSVLADAQRATETTAIERLWTVVGQLAASDPEVLDVADNVSLLRTYADLLRVPQTGLRSKDEVAQRQQARQQQLQAQQDAVVGENLTKAAQNLSNTDVGGGQNALAAIVNGG